jgi:hypothetical protein
MASASDDPNPGARNTRDQLSFKRLDSIYLITLASEQVDTPASGPGARQNVSWYELLFGRNVSPQPPELS